MTKRLQVLLPETELRDIQRIARRHHMTTAAWVRQALREAQRAQAGPTAIDKLAVVRRASAFAFPSGDIAAITAEIERGYADTES